MSGGRLVGWRLDISTPNPIATFDQKADQVMPDESPGAGDKDPCWHCLLTCSVTAGAMTYEAVELMPEG